MDIIKIIYLVLIFITVFLVVLVVLTQLVARPLKGRLQLVSGGSKPQVAVVSDIFEEPTWLTRIVEFTQPIAKFSLPSEGWENQSCVFIL